MSMQAIQIHQTGGPEVLQLVELPRPEPAPGEVRVRAEAIGAGRPDVLIRNGTYKWMPPLPAIPGSELAGTVDAVGSGVNDFRVGTRVLVSARELSTRGGCYAQFICVPAAAVFVLPDSISPVDAVSLPNFQLGNALMRSNGGAAAQSMLVPGAAGGVASALVQLARLRGMQVIGTASTPEKQAFARAHGVHDLVDADPERLPEAVMALTDGRGVDLAFDHLGGRSIIACLRALAPFGMLVSYNVVQGPPERDVFKEMRSLLGRSLALRTFSMHTFDIDPTVRRALMTEAIEQMASGQVRAPKATVLPLAQVRQAHDMLDAGSGLGKIVLQP